MQEPHLSASPDGELLECADVVNEEIHETQLVTEAHEDVEARRVQGDTVRLLRKLTVQLQVAVINTQVQWI